jgi:LysM repeat protein
MEPLRAKAFLVAALFSGFALFGALSAVAQSNASAAKASDPQGGQRPRVYLFRGFAGMAFARGVDTLAEMIRHAGLSATVNEAIVCPIIAQEAVRDYRANPAPIVAIGHSVGAACAIAFAQMLNAEKIIVSLVVTTDPNRIAGDVPLNVERYINIFQSNSILGGRDVQPAKGFSGHYASYDLAEHEDITHLNIEKMPTIHDQVFTKIQQLTATPAKVGAEPLPIRLVVPADADLELWDSGTSVVTRSGDTVQSIAAEYRVPVWALTQINRLPQDGSPAAGVRIIVPQHLLPLTAATDSAERDQAPKR